MQNNNIEAVCPMKSTMQALTEIKQQQQQQDRKVMAIDMPIETRTLPASQRFAWGSRTRYAPRIDASAREQNKLR
jgi:hypothetical protein